MKKLPFGAHAIMDARKRGQKPSDMILVSSCGKLKSVANPTVLALPSGIYDWTWVRGLVICFWMTPETYVARHVVDCAKARPAQMIAWDAANERGYFLSCLPTVGSIDGSNWEWQVFADRWLERQEQEFALGELVWN